VALKDAVEAGDGTGIAPLHEFDPEDNKSGMRVPAAHVKDQFQLLRGMLIGMRMRPGGKIPEGIPGPVITVLPPINILTVHMVMDGSFSNAVLFSVVNKG